MPGCSAPPPPIPAGPTASTSTSSSPPAASSRTPSSTWPTSAPSTSASWRERLAADEQANSTIRRKLTALRSLFSYLQTYGYSGANPAHGKFVKAPAVSRDGKTVGLSPHDCRRLLNAPEEKPELQTPVDCRDRAMLAVLAYSGCRVGELVRLCVRDYKHSGEHRILNVTGKGGKERTTPLHLEAVERLADWLAVPGIKEDPAGPLFPAARSPRGMGRDGFAAEPMSTRAVEKLIGRYVEALGLDPNVTVHSLRVTALTTARERGIGHHRLAGFRRARRPAGPPSPTSAPATASAKARPYVLDARPRKAVRTDESTEG